MLVRNFTRNVFALSAVLILVAASVGEAQEGRRGPRGQRGFGRFGRGGNPFGLLQNEYLQKELNFTEAQKKRLREISIQLEGTRALLRDDVKRELGLSDTQVKKIEEIRNSAFSGLRNLFRRGGGGQRPNFDEIRKKIQQAREKSDKEILNVLTTKQREKFEQMKGKPIDREKLFQRREEGRRRPDV